MSLDQCCAKSAVSKMHRRSSLSSLLMACSGYYKNAATRLLRAGVVTPKDTLHADVIVLAAALGIPELTEPLGLSVPLTAKPRTVTVITKPLKPILKHIVVNGKPSVCGICHDQTFRFICGCNPVHRRLCYRLHDYSKPATTLVYEKLHLEHAPLLSCCLRLPGQDRTQSALSCARQGIMCSICLKQQC